MMRFYWESYTVLMFMHMRMDVTAAIRSLAAQISSSKEDAVPRLLLRLKDTFRRSRLDSRERRESAYHLLWQRDLIHVMVGVTRRDFSRVSGGWETAAQLAELLATVCSGLKPQESHSRKKKKKSAVDKSKDNQVKDFYEKLLPAAVDSLLILANNILEHTTASKYHIQPNSSVLHTFQSVLISLSRLGSSHRECVFRALQSPLVLNMIASNQPQFSLAVVTTLNNLNVDQQTVSSAIQSHPQTILDVLAYKITCSENESELQTECLKLLAAFIDPNSSDEVVRKLCSKYTTLASVAVALRTSGLGSRAEQFVRRLEMQLPPHTPPPPSSAGVDDTREDTADSYLTGSQTLRNDQRRHSPTQGVRCAVSHREPTTSAGSANVRHSAATVIQASWRGYVTRQQLKIEDEILKFETEDAGLTEFETEDAGLTEFDGVVSFENDAEIKKHLNSLSEMRTFHEKQMSLLEQLPASKVPSFLHTQRVNAATLIQSWWRGKLGREDFRWRRAHAQTEAAASVIQRAVRIFLRGRRAKRQLQPRVSGSACFLEGCERDELQVEIAKYRKEHPPPSYSETQLRQVHDEVQQLLGDFYSRNTLQTVSQETRVRRDAFLARLEHDCNLLLSAPRLSEAGEDGVERFSSGSKAVATMAHQMHSEEKRATELPWWKRPLMASNEELLQLLN